MQTTDISDSIKIDETLNSKEIKIEKKIKIINE